MRDTYNPFYDRSLTLSRERPRLRFSRLETKHLALAVAVLTVAFAFILVPGNAIAVRFENLVRHPIYLVAAFVAVASGFIMHELAHKLYAIRYGCWAEFRAHPFGLMVGLFLALALKVLLAIPGAVVIMGRITQRENGIISIVGPATNIAIAAIALPFTFVMSPDQGFPFVMGVVAFVNALLAVFNLLPFSILDGKKVWRWSRFWWVTAMLAAVGLLVQAYLRMPLF